MNITSTTNLLAGKIGLITGIASNMSISWAVAQCAQKHGANLIFSYQLPSFKDRVSRLAQDIGCNAIYQCDLGNQTEITRLCEVIKTEYNKIDFLVHSVAFANKHNLTGKYLNTPMEDFLHSMNVSCYSLVALARGLEPLMRDHGGSIVTMTYYGSQKVIPNYNVMGVAKAALEASVKYLAHDLGEYNIRVNAISAGAIHTPAANAIHDFKKILEYGANSPLKRVTNIQDVANSTIYLLSDLSTGVTGEVHYVDNGGNILAIHTL